MYTPLTLLALATTLPGPPVQAECDVNCGALEAALEWALDEAPGSRRAPTYVEIGFRPAGEPPRTAPPFLARDSVLREVASRRGVPTVKAGDTAFSHPCLQDLSSPPCEAGTTWLAITNARVVSGREVLVNLRTIIAEAPGQSVSVYGNVRELRLRRVADLWRVIDSRVTLIVN